MHTINPLHHLAKISEFSKLTIYQLALGYCIVICLPPVHVDLDEDIIARCNIRTLTDCHLSRVMGSEGEVGGSTLSQPAALSSVLVQYTTCFFGSWTHWAGTSHPLYHIITYL